MAVSVDARARWVWVGCAALAAIVGVTAGALGLAGRPQATPEVQQLVGAVAARIPALDCPGGAVIGSLGDGDRVLVIARTPDGDFLAVRSPGSDYATVWVAAASVDTGPIEASLARADLPVDDCVHPEVDE